jgi:hypothetical protein
METDGRGGRSVAPADFSGGFVKGFWLIVCLIMLRPFVSHFMGSTAEDRSLVREKDMSIVQIYVNTLAREDMLGAYELLSERLRKNLSLKAFTRVQDKRLVVKGKIQFCRLIHQKVSHSLFSERRKLRLLYRLEYINHQETGWLLLEEGDKDRFSIGGTCQKPFMNSVDALVW